ncbi:MAG: hypothetical protein ACI4Q6_09540 [Huintestinicola sp.]
MMLGGCTQTDSGKLPELSIITEKEATDIISEIMTSAPAVSEDVVTSEETSAVSSEETVLQTEETPNEAVSDLEDAALSLMGALDYIDQIGGGNIPKEDSTVIVNEREYAKVKSQFGNTADLREYMESVLSDSLIESRYSQILGTEEPYYIDIDGELYGYVTAKGCGFPWIMEGDSPKAEISDVTDSSFTAKPKFDNFGGECEMVMHIVFEDGAWKISSIEYDGLSF